MNSTTKNCTTIIAAKNTNGAPFECVAICGNANEITAFMIQCADEPKLCPFDRTAVGNTSLMYTQITAPCEMAKNAMYPISSQTRYDCCEFVMKIAATPANASAVPTEPISK